MNHDVGDSINPVYNSLCQSVRYLPEIRSSVSQYLVQSRYRQVTFTRSITHHPVINSLVTLSSLWWCPTEWAQRYLSVTRSDKSQSRLVPTQQTLLEIPVVCLYSHPVTCDVWHTQSIPTASGSCTISWSKEIILDIRKALADKLYDLVLCLGLGLVHHIILLMMWSHYQWHPMSMVRKP